MFLLDLFPDSLIHTYAIVTVFFLLFINTGFVYFYVSIFVSRQCAQFSY